jgi:hypothetical protein
MNMKLYLRGVEEQTVGGADALLRRSKWKLAGKVEDVARKHTILKGEVRQDECK